MTKGQECNEYIHRVFATIKNYLLLLYHVRVVKYFRISHIILRPLLRENLTLSHVNNKGTYQSAHQASLMGAFVICSLESIIAKQLKLIHSKLQASIEQADFSKMWWKSWRNVMQHILSPLIILTELLLFKLIEDTFVLHVHNCKYFASYWQPTFINRLKKKNGHKYFHGGCTVALSCNAWLETEELPGLSSSSSLHYVFEHINTCLILVKPMKNHPDITENILTGTLRIKSSKQTRIFIQNF